VSENESKRERRKEEKETKKKKLRKLLIFFCAHQRLAAFSCSLEAKGRERGFSKSPTAAVRERKSDE